VACNATDGDTAVQSAYATEFADTTSVKPDAAAAAEMYSTNRLAYLKHTAASHGTAKGAITPIVIAQLCIMVATAAVQTLYMMTVSSFTLLYIAVMLTSYASLCISAHARASRAIVHYCTAELYSIYSNVCIQPKRLYRCVYMYLRDSVT
jgi:hypothetical protein